MFDRNKQTKPEPPPSLLLSDAEQRALKYVAAQEEERQVRARVEYRERQNAQAVELVSVEEHLRRAACHAEVMPGFSHYDTARVTFEMGKAIICAMRERKDVL